MTASGMVVMIYNLDAREVKIGGPLGFSWLAKL